MTELKVKEIINSRGIRVVDFAAQLGITREHCYKILKGKSVSQKQIEKMAAILNLPVRDLYKLPDAVTEDYNPYYIVYGRTEHYRFNDIVTFGKLAGEFGAFSNMSTEYPVEAFGHHCFTSEHLFIALRFSGHPKMQEEILRYKNSMWCKKIFVNNKDYKPLHHPNWHDNYFDVEVMKYIINLKYGQNKGFRKLLEKTKGKIIVEDTTMQNMSNAVSRWGCVDLQKKDVIKQTRSDVNKYARSLDKEDDAKIAKAKSQARRDAIEKKRKWRNSLIEKVKDVYEKSLKESATYTLVGENAMGKILTEIRDKGHLDYHLDYPLYLFHNEIK